jgi:fibronectin type 3 domain-containing protein
MILALLLIATATVQTVPKPSVTLAWDANDPTENVLGYNVYRTTTPANVATYAKLNTAPITATTYTDSTVQYGQSAYSYVVTAFNDTAESAFSASVSATIGNRPPPSPPKNLRIVQVIAAVFKILSKVGVWIANLF